MRRFMQKHAKLFTVLILLGGIIVFYLVSELPNIIENSKYQANNKTLYVLRDESYRCSDSADKAALLLYSPNNSKSGDFTSDYLPEALFTTDAAQVRYLVRLNCYYKSDGMYVTQTGSYAGSAFRWVYEATITDLRDGSIVAENTFLGSGAPQETTSGSQFGKRPAEDEVIVWISNTID